MGIEYYMRNGEVRLPISPTSWKVWNPLKDCNQLMLIIEKMRSDPEFYIELSLAEKWYVTVKNKNSIGRYMPFFDNDENLATAVIEACLQATAAKGVLADE